MSITFVSSSKYRDEWLGREGWGGGGGKREEVGPVDGI